VIIIHKRGIYTQESDWFVSLLMDIFKLYQKKKKKKRMKDG
jgi:hypothetical protein